MVDVKARETVAARNDPIDESFEGFLFGGAIVAQKRRELSSPIFDDDSSKGIDSNDEDSNGNTSKIGNAMKIDRRFENALKHTRYS